MRKFLLAFSLLLLSVQSFANVPTPHFLYKILSPAAWTESQGMQSAVINSPEETYILLTREDQLTHLLDKNWANIPAVVLKVDASKLVGDLVFEEDATESGEYYHLYNGQIPQDAVIEIDNWN